MKAINTLLILMNFTSGIWYIYKSFAVILFSSSRNALALPHRFPSLFSFFSYSPAPIQFAFVTRRTEYPEHRARLL